MSDEYNVVRQCLERKWRRLRVAKKTENPQKLYTCGDLVDDESTADVDMTFTKWR